MLQDPVTPSRRPPATPDLSSQSLSPSSPFEWSDLHRHPRYAPSSSSSRYSRISNASYISTLSSAPSLNPLTPCTPPALALPPPQYWPRAPTFVNNLYSSETGGADEPDGLGLGLTLEDALPSGSGNKESKSDVALDIDNYTRNLARLDSILLHLQTMIETGELALSDLPRNDRAVE